MKREVIGEGSYGCVHKPSLPCDIKPREILSYKNYISKLMTQDNAINEYNEFMIFANIDKENKYFLDKPIICNPKFDKDIINDIKKCKNIDIDNIELFPNNYKLLISKYGGFDLYNFCENELSNYLKTNQQYNSDLFWLNVHNIIKGIKFLRQHGLVHNDLKPQNILFNIENGNLKFIDFGLMRTRSEIKRLSELDENYLGSFHWSYPFDCGFMNKKQFDKYKDYTKASRNELEAEFTDMLVSGSINNYYNLPINHPESFNILFNYINPELVESDPIVKNGYINDFFNDLNMNINRLSYDNYLNRTIDSIDIYGLGFSLQFVLNHFNKKNAIGETFVRRCSELFRKMYDFTPSTRELDIDKLLNEYEDILLDSGILVRMGKTFINNVLTNKIPVSKKLLREYKEYTRRTPKKLSKKLQTIASMDPPRIFIEKQCPQGTEINPQTNRCNNLCKIGYRRNEKFKCRKTERKNKNKKISMRPKSLTKKSYIRICHEEKELNPQTNRCNRICKIGYRRDEKFKCKKVY
jgi:serine/threonine protein kinase